MYHVICIFSTAIRRKRKPSLDDSYSDISSVSSSSDSDVSMEEEKDNAPSSPSLAVPTTSKTIETESDDEESDDDSDIYEQLRNARKLSVNSVYSDKESSEEELEERELSQKEESSPPPVSTLVHTDHIYAKPPKTPEAQNDNDDFVEMDEEAEKLKREELLTAQARQHSFPVRSAEEEPKILDQFYHGYGPEKEDVEMFKLALKRMKQEKGELVTDVPWAYYPADILFIMIVYIFCVKNLFPQDEK